VCGIKPVVTSVPPVSVYSLGSTIRPFQIRKNAFGSGGAGEKMNVVLTPLIAPAG
jgi:hypothetical protein